MEERLYSRILKIVVGSHAGMALGRERWALWLCMSMGTITIANSPVISPTWCQFPETKERGLDFRFLGYFFFQLWFYGLFHKMSFPPTFCWYSLSVRFSVHAYEPRRLKQLERPASFIFFCSDPFPSPSLSMTELQSPQFSVLQLTSKYQLNTKVQRAVSPVDIGMWIPGDTSVDLTLQVLKMLGCKMV